MINLLNCCVGRGFCIVVYLFNCFCLVHFGLFLSHSQVLAGEEADITSSMLNTDDDDTSAEDLVYHIEMPMNGMVALKEEPEEAISNFTQAHINKGEVIFIHEGESPSCKFTA